MSVLDVPVSRGRVAPHAGESHPSAAGAGGTGAALRAHTGEALTLDIARWHAPATDEEQALLAALDGPVIDLGCGPGRLVISAASRRLPALGVDCSPSAIALARRRGATVLERDLFGRLPGEGRWGSVLLFDGNIGIGGDPARLLSRCRRLVAGHGQVVVEVEPPGTRWRPLMATVEGAAGRSDPFAWAVVGADAVAGLAAVAGLRLTSTARTPSGRWFAYLRPSSW